MVEFRSPSFAKLSKKLERAHPDHFTPRRLQATWLFTELAPDGDTLFGLCDVGHGSPEIGYASLAEIQALRGPMRLLVERDRSFRADKPLSEYASEARRRGRIIA
jgi:hypothetical protein